VLRSVVAQIRSVRWASVATVVGAGLVALVALAAVLRGRGWAWVPFVLAAAIAVREVRQLQRARRRHAGFDEPDRRQRRR
jgi:4-hydroxybenzoate polyprenyltransferase